MKMGVCFLCTACILFAAAVHAADDWTKLTPSPHPGGRYYHGAAYIGGDQVLVFGGWDGALDDETWVYDLSGNTWTQKFPSPKPSPRQPHTMAYIGGDQVLLFGGLDTSDVNDETWIYDLSGNTWTQKFPSSKPSARYAQSMAYIGGDQALLFGGWDGAYSNETWVYDLSGNTWTLQSPSSKPSLRSQQDMAYIGGDQVLLFGGRDAADENDETWLYDLSEDNWFIQSPASRPSKRYRHVMAYIGGDQVLLFGGQDPNRDDETWVYDLSEDNWTQDTNTTQPSPRYAPVLSETSMDGSRYLVLFGGNDGAFDDETWTFGGGDYALPVELSCFTATGGDGIITLRWTTQSEQDNWGFHIYRKEEAGRNYQRVTPELIPGAGNSATSKTYTWQDRRVENGHTYWYQLESVDFQGETQRYGPVSAAPLEAQPEMQAMPRTCRLFPNYPNPFNPETWISYQLPDAGPVSIKIYNIHGQLVNTLLDAQQSPGFHRIRWDGRDLHGASVASGVYLCQLRSQQLVETIRMILLR